MAHTRLHTRCTQPQSTFKAHSKIPSFLSHLIAAYISANPKLSRWLSLAKHRHIGPRSHGDKAVQPPIARTPSAITIIPLKAQRKQRRERVKVDEEESKGTSNVFDFSPAPDSIEVFSLRVSRDSIAPRLMGPDVSRYVGKPSLDIHRADTTTESALAEIESPVKRGTHPWAQAPNQEYKKKESKISLWIGERNTLKLSEIEL